MKFRKLRIAWSVLCGIACVLLILLWVRSYWWNDSVFKRLGTRELLLQMRLGEVGIWVTPTKLSQLPSEDTQWRIGKERPTQAYNYLMIEGSTVVPVDGPSDSATDQTCRTQSLGFHSGRLHCRLLALREFHG